MTPAGVISLILVGIALLILGLVAAVVDLGNAAQKIAEAIEKQSLSSRETAKSVRRVSPVNGE